MTINPERTWTIGGVTYTIAPLETKARYRNAFDPDQPRDRKGRWIETGATVSIWGGGSGTVARNLGGGRLEVHTADGKKLAVHRNYLTVTAAPGGKKPSGRPADRPRPLRASKPSTGIQDYTPDSQDTRVPVSQLQPGQVALVYGWDQYGAATSSIGRVSQVSQAGPPEGTDAKPGSGWAVSFVDENTNRFRVIYTSDDAVARVVPSEDFDALVEAERSGDESAATRLALDIYERIRSEDDAEASAQSSQPAPARRVRLANGAEGTIVEEREDGALLVQLDSGSRVNVNASAVTRLDTPPQQAEETAPSELTPGQWITTPAFHDPVRVEVVQDTLTGAEVEVTTIRGDRRTLAVEELGDWKPTSEPPNHRADGAPATPQTRPQEGLFADMGTDKDGNRDLFMALDADKEQSPTAGGPRDGTAGEEASPRSGASSPDPASPGEFPPFPDGFSRAERELLLGLTEEESAAYAFTGWPSRYVAELFAKQSGKARYAGDSDPAVQEWVDAYLRANPSVLELTPRERETRRKARKARAEQAQARAKELRKQAHTLFTAGDFDGALAMIDEAAELAPHPDWDRIRGIIRTGQAAASSPQEQPQPEQQTGDQRGVDVPDAAGRSGDEPTQQPQPDADHAQPKTRLTPREPAPEGKAYADEIKVGDTIEEAISRTPIGNGALREGQSVYANPAGPRRLGEPERDSRRVTDIRPAWGGAGLTFVFDDGTQITRSRDELVTRGAPVEVRDGEQRVGEWVPQAAAEPGDRIRFPKAGPTLPTSLDREAFGVGRFERVTVEGRIVRRQQPSVPAVVLDDVAIVREDGTRVGVPGQTRFSLPRRVVRLDDSQPTPPPSQVRPAELARGDRITGPTGDVVVDTVDVLDDGLVAAVVRDDADGRHRHVITVDTPVRLASTPDGAVVDEVEAGSLAAGDRIVLDDVALQVASDPELVGGRVRFDTLDTEGRLAEVEMDRWVLVAKVTGTPTPARDDSPASAASRLVEVEPLPEGTPTGRVRLRTDQRRRLLELNLDADSSTPPAVRQAAARLRARRELSAVQMRALADHLRTMAGDEALPGARRRALGRAAWWIDAAYARLEGFPPPPHHPGRARPERAFARNLVMGDTIALPDEDGNVRFGTVTAIRPIRGFGLHTVHVRHEDGSVEQRVLPDGVDLWLMPDLTPDQPSRPSFAHEHLTPDRIGVGDLVRWDGDQLHDPVLGRVVSIALKNSGFAEVRRYEMTVVDSENRPQTVTVNDRGWPSLVRLERGPDTADQPYDSVMPPEGDGEYVGWRDLRVGDRATVDLVTGTITGITRHPATGDTPEGATITILSDSGELRNMPVFDDPDRPEDVPDFSVMRRIKADDNAAARVQQTLQARERAAREREFTAFLADLETSRSRWAATDVADTVRGMPTDADRDTVLAAALARLDQVEQLADTAASTLAFRLGARDDTQAAAMQPATRAITDAVKQRATSRIRRALQDADRLPGETWPQAVARIAGSYRDQPPTPGVLPAGSSLARLRDRLTGRPSTPEPARPPVMPQGADLAARMAAYRGQLPDDLTDFGKRPIVRTVFEPTTLDQLEAGAVPRVKQVTLWAPDVADDDGPGREAMRQLAVIRAAGADLDVRFQQHLAGRDVALAAELEAVIRERGQAWKDADTLDAEIARVRRDGGTPDQALLERRDELAASWQAAAQREAELRRMIAETRRRALAATLAELRPVGGEGLAYTDRTGKPLSGRVGSNAAALRYVEQVLPSDWLDLARAAGPVEVVTGPGQHTHVRADGTTRISLPADDDTAEAPVIRDGQPGRVPLPSSQPEGVAKATVAAHELAHHLEAVIPGLREAGHALLWDRTSQGEVGHRTRPEPIEGEDRGRPFSIYPGDFPDPRTGRVNADGTQEVFANVLESLTGNGDYVDDDLRQWGLGVLALLGTGKQGPQGGRPAEEAEQRDPLEGVNLLSLSDDQLRSLIARISDPDALARLRAELERRREQRDRDIDLSELSDAELESMLLAGWDGYGEDPDKTALQDRVIAEVEAREAERNRRGDELGDLAASDLLDMETDDLAVLFGRNVGRYGTDPSVTALLDQIAAELEERDRRRHAEADPYAGLDLASMSDEELWALYARHKDLYYSDPRSAALVRRIFAEMDARDRRHQTDGRTDEEKRIDALIAQGWDPRDAYAEVHGLDVEEMERQERLAIIDAQRGKGERREQVVRRMYQQWVYEQWLEAEKATNGYLLSPLGRRAGVDPQRLWGGNPVHAYAYASEELKRWWADQPGGGRMTFEEWRAQWLGSRRDAQQARERRITAGNGKDFG